MRKPSVVVQKIRERLDGLEERQDRREERRAYRLVRIDLKHALRDGLMATLDQAIEVCGWLPTRHKVSPGDYGTKRLYTACGYALLFGPDGQYMALFDAPVPADFFDEPNAASSAPDTVPHDELPADVHSS